MSVSRILAIFLTVVLALQTPYPLQAASEPKFSIRLFNIDDHLKAYSNGSLVASGDYGGDTGQVPIPAGAKSITLVLTNDVGGWTWGYELYENGAKIDSDFCGSPGVSGCFNDDTKLGIVFTKTLTLPPPPPLIPRLSDEQKQIASDLSKIFAKFGVAISVEAKFCVLLGPLAPGCLEAAAVGKIVTKVLAGAAWLASIDPADPDFKTIVQPSFPAFPKVSVSPDITAAQANAINAFSVNAERIIGYMRALIASNNKYQGAAEAGNALWMARQLQVGDYYAIQLAQLLDSQRSLASTVDQLVGMSTHATLLTAQNIGEYKATLVSGFPANVLQNLQAAGFSESDIRVLTTSEFTAQWVVPQVIYGMVSNPELDHSLTILRDGLLRLAADRNNDQQVTCADVALVKTSFGKASTDPAYDPHADVTMDGRIDIRDLAFVSRELPAGTRCQ
jgi:hypothetical protein